MQKAFELRYLRRVEIDTNAWDACIEKSPDGLIYARSFYLDQMADNWDGIVMNNYEAVMPLPWRKKWGFQYVYQLPFVQRLGIYGLYLSKEITAKFYETAFRHISFFHYKTGSAFIDDTLVNRTCKNLVIDLLHPYTEIKNAFSEECKKNIRKAEKRGCSLHTDTSVFEVVHFFKAAYSKYYPQYTKETYERLASLIEEGIKLGKCKTYSIVNKDNESVFVAALFRDEKRIYYCVGAPNEEGRQMRAAYFFINEILKLNASQPLLFDFEGSDLPNVASFYNKFSPTIEMYSEVRINKLPILLKWLKK